MTVHEVKLLSQFWDATIRGDRSFDVRLDSHNFKVNDVLKMCEWKLDADRYTGRKCYRLITYVLYAEDIPTSILPSGYVIMSLEKIPFWGIHLVGIRTAVSNLR